MTSIDQSASKAMAGAQGRAWTAQQFFVAAVPAIFLFAVIAFAPSVIPDGDPYWHIAAGEWMLRNGAIPTSDPFSHTFAGAPWTTHEWLTEVILAVTYRAAGWSGLHLLVAAAAATSSFLLARQLLRYLEPFPALIVLQFALANIVIVGHARPQFLTFPIIITWLSELIEARREERAPSWLLLPLMILWANMHGSFILGLALLGPFALEAMIAAKAEWRKALLNWALFGVGALLAALVNPSGLEGVLFPLKLMSMSSLSYIEEWQSSSFEQIAPFEVMLLAILFFCLLRGVRIPIIRLVLLLGMLHQGLAHRRMAIVFAIGAALLLAEPIANALKATSRAQAPLPARSRMGLSAIALLFIGGLSLLRLANPVVLEDDEKTPLTALASVPAPLLQQPVFNEYRFGGYLIFSGVRPFIDGRADMYGDDFIRQIAELNQKKPAEIEELFAKYGITWAIVNPTSDREHVFDTLGWHLQYKDKYASVYLRDAATEPAGEGTTREPVRPPG